jgi:Family of unknown function (DUF5681)
VNKQTKNTLWKPGESGNPAGRPLGSRNKLSESVIQDIAADWAIGGAETIARVRMTDPATYFRVVASILPKDVLVNVQQQAPAGLDADDWSRMVALARTMRDIAPDASLEQIEHALRSAFAKTIEQ